MKANNALLIGAGALALLWASRTQASTHPSPVDWNFFDEFVPVYGGDWGGVPDVPPDTEQVAAIDEAGDGFISTLFSVQEFAPRVPSDQRTLMRGERNNNPGNIMRTSTRWKGMAADQSSDSRYIVFIAPEYGIRALARVLTTYYERYGLNTVRQIISRWAPPSENDTAAYVRNVANALGVSPDEPIDVLDAGTLWTLVDRIIIQENGRNIYDAEVLASGIGAAYA